MFLTHFLEISRTDAKKLFGYERDSCRHDTVERAGMLRRLDVARKFLWKGGERFPRIRYNLAPLSPSNQKMVPLRGPVSHLASRVLSLHLFVENYRK